MKTYGVTVTDGAWADLRAAVDFIAADAPDRAADWLEAALAAMGSLEQFPHRCPTAPEQSLFSGEIRQLLHRPYRIIFRVEATKVTILRVRHGAREPLPHFDD